VRISAVGIRLGQKDEAVDAEFGVPVNGGPVQRPDRGDAELQRAEVARNVWQYVWQRRPLQGYSDTREWTKAHVRGRPWTDWTGPEKRKVGGSIPPRPPRR